MFHLPEWLISLLLIAANVVQQPQTSPAQTPPQTPPQTKPAAPAVDRKVPLSERSQLTITDFNTGIAVDKRVIVMMAALNAGGYDYETGNRQISGIRRQMREDLKDLDPAVARKLHDHLARHSAGKVDATAVAPYLSLALSLTEPPAFLIETSTEKLPEDVREITDFTQLLEEFYAKTSFGKLMPKYVAAYQTAAQGYFQTTAQAVSGVVSYLHTVPILELPPNYVFRPSPSKDRKAQPEPVEKAPPRERYFVILPDLFNATAAANLRVIGDNYVLLLGPSSEPGAQSIRRGFMRFVVDPLIERQIKSIASSKGDLKKLLETRGDKVDPEYQRSAYSLISDSMTRAADARMSVLGISSTRKYSEMDAIADLSLAYERGAVLVYHFYDQLAAYERAGVDVKDYVGAMLEKIDFEREAMRLDEYGQRLARYREAKLNVNAAPPTEALSTISNADEKVVARLLEADKLISRRSYVEARAILEDVRRERPNNARALFGLGEVTSKQASATTDADKLSDELYAAVEFYRRAAENASSTTEVWLKQRSYVAAGKILTFLDQFDDASAAFDLAIKLGPDADKAAYDEAVKAKQQHDQKGKP
jgi:tetratricopeptide (TPR) repeat protein